MIKKDTFLLGFHAVSLRNYESSIFAGTVEVENGKKENILALLAGSAGSAGHYLRSVLPSSQCNYDELPAIRPEKTE